MRICSLVPAATEILFALGLGEQVVGITHECDWPPEAATTAAVTASLVETDELSSAAIDRSVSDAAGAGRPLYAIDEERWAEIEAEVVVAQELCEVCAVSTNELEDIVAARAVDVTLLEYSPRTLDGIVDAIEDLGRSLGAEAAAGDLTEGMRTRLVRVRMALAGAETTPRVFVSEWLDPPFAAGHWVPDMVEAAGGIEVAGMSGTPSFRMRWQDVAALKPDVVVLAPCGYDLDRTIGEVVPLELSAHLLGTAARQESRVFAVDANGYFSRPGPRVVDGVELLAYLLHPESYSDSSAVPWSRVRL